MISSPRPRHVAPRERAQREVSPHALTSLSLTAWPRTHILGLTNERSAKTDDARCKVNQAINHVGDVLPVLHAGHPIWYRGQVRAVAAGDEVYSIGWVEPRERPVLRAMALAVFEAPSLTPDQQLSFAAYYLLPEDTWRDLRQMPDELVALHTGLPLDLIQRRRTLPTVDPVPGDLPREAACA